MNKRLSVLFFLSLLFLGVSGFPKKLKAQLDPGIQWREIETESAYWIFDARHQEVAVHFILKFQKAKAEVFPLFREGSEKITFLIIDNTDSANGSAQVTPHPIVRIFPVPPSFRSSIGEFSDPVYEILVHEYTHILNMEPVHGFLSFLSLFFGSIAHPNMALPRWYTEGLAVYTESLLSEGGGGRLNSQYLEGLARSLTLEDRWEDYPLTQLNDFHPDWLGGSRAYFFGGILWDGLVRGKGLSLIRELNQSYSRRIPYLINGPLEDRLGGSYSEQLIKAYEFWQLQSQKQIDRILESPQMSEEEIPLGNGQHYGPSISPDGSWLASLVDDPQEPGIDLIPRKDFGTESEDKYENQDEYENEKTQVNETSSPFLFEKSRRIVIDGGIQSLNWHPKSSGFVYEKMTPYKFYYNFYDLYFHDLEKRENIQITRGTRAHQSCFGPGGNVLYFLQNRASSKNIVAMDMETKSQNLLYSAEIGVDIRSLSCSGDFLFFVEQKGGFPPHMGQWDIQKGKKTIFFDEIPVNFLKVTKEGILVSSSTSGVENLYLIDKETKKFRAVTNSLTRIVDGDIDPLDGSLYFSQLGSRGLKVFYLRENQWKSLASSVPKIEPILNDFSNLRQKIKTADESPVEPVASKTINEKAEREESVAFSTDVDNEKNFESRSFSPWRYLYPNHWLPFIYFVDGGSLYQAITSAGDPLGINQLSLILQWDSLTRKPGASFSYINNSWPVSLGFALSDFYNFFYSTRDNLHVSNGRAFMSYPLSWLSHTRLSLFWNYSVLGFQGNTFNRQGPQLEATYNNLRRKRNDVSYSSGWRLQLGHKSYFPDLSNTAYEETYGHIGSFWSSFTPKRHAFYLGLNASFAPQLNNSFFAANTLAGPFFNPTLINTAFLQRGYPTGLFVARNIINTNVEYHFPLLSFYKGTILPPLFIQNLKGALVFDSTTLDGRYNDSRFPFPRRASLGRWFTGYGLELESNITLGFHLPIALTLGFYYGHEKESFGGFTTFFNIRL